MESTYYWFDAKGNVSKVLKEVIERVESWPGNRQDAAAHVLMEMEAQEESPYRLSDEQVAKVQRRLAYGR